MAFGFDDFAGLFDPISDALGTSGRQGMGLLQQEPEDIQRAAMIAALVASGVGAFAAPGAAAGAAAGTTAAGVPATLVTPTATGILGAADTAALAAPELATGITSASADVAANEAAQLAMEEAAREATRQSIVQANQLTPDVLASLEPNAAGIQQLAGPMDSGASELYQYKTNAAGNKVLEGTARNPFPTENLISNTTGGAQPIGGNASTYLSEPTEQLITQNTPEYANYLDATNTSRYRGSFDDYQRINLENEFAKRSAAAPPSTIQQFDNPASTTQSVFRGNPAESGFQPPQVSRGGYFNNGITGEYTDTLGPFERGMRSAVDLVTKYPKTSAAAAYITAARAGLLDQAGADAPKDNYKNPYNMSGFRRSSPNPTAYQYTPRYAQGGIASINGYARGKKVASNAATDFTDFYDQMNARSSTAELKHGSPGIYYDADPDTRYLDPMEAAMVRMSKLNSRANVQAPTMTPARRMGELDFKPVAAAQGGIMGYADGGDVLIEEDEFNRLTGRGGGRGGVSTEPAAKFSPTSEGAAAVSKFGQGMKGYPALAPGSMAAQVIGAIASAYGDHMARNVNPDYSNEGRQQMQAAQSAAQDARIASFDAGRTHEGGGGGQGASVSSSDFGGGSVDPAGRDSDGTPLAKGGITSIHAPYNLGGYAAGGNPRLLRGPGDGMSDHIPATINNRQPARLADGEYVITADVVSHLGNGSTEAGARQLDAMMKRIRKGRTGTPKQGKQINPRKYLPA